MLRALVSEFGEASVLRALQQHGARRFYASYGPAYRLTYASGETVIGSQPWNERFLHHPHPEVRREAAEAVTELR